MKQTKSRWGFIIILLAILFSIGFILAGIVALFLGEENLGGNVALIPVKGFIATDGDEGIFSENIAASTTIMEYIGEAAEDPSITAIIFEINSPGGGPVASEEIVNAIKKANITTVAWIREIGTSGAYWIASATDHIVASRVSLTGSVGVIASYLQFSGFLEDHNITYQRLVAGKYKDLANPLKELSYEERLILQAQLDSIHDYFVGTVKENRNLNEEQLKEVEKAGFYTGEKAKELNLIDEFGSKQEAIDYISKKLNITVELRSYEAEEGLFDFLDIATNKKSFFIGKGIGAALMDKRRSGIEIIT